MNTRSEIRNRFGIQSTLSLSAAFFIVWRKFWPSAENAHVFKWPNRIRSNRTMALFCLAFCCAAFLCGLPNVVVAQIGSSVVVWGNNAYGQTNVPPGLTNVIAIAASSDHCLALKADGKVVAWGDNSYGQTNVPPGLSNVIAIAAGDVHSLALKSNGTVVAWGANRFGVTNVPASLSNVVAIAAGWHYNLALKSDGTVATWSPTNVPLGLSNVVAIACGSFHSLALKSDGTVVAWGDSEFGQTNVPPGLNHVIAIAAGYAHNLVLMSNGTVVAWMGSTTWDYGQADVPADLTNVIAIAGGGLDSLALKSDGKVVAWGYNGSGQTNVPAGLSGAAAIATGGSCGMVLTGRMVIQSQPASKITAPGSNVWLQVQVSGATPITYQWFFNVTNLIADATNAVLQLTNVQSAQSGAYAVVVSNYFGSLTSSPAILTVTVVPVITAAQPTNQEVFAGDTANFSVMAGGAPPLAYQWFFGTDAIVGATDSTLQLTNVQLSQTGTYWAVVTNVYGAATSAPAMLGVRSPGVVTSCTEADLRLVMARSRRVTFACDGTIILASTITNTDDLVLDGSGHSITVSGNNAVRVFVVPTNVTLTLNHLTIADGITYDWVYGGGGLLNLGTVNATDCNFCNNIATNSTGFGAAGGAIYNYGSMNLDLCKFEGNQALGGLYLVNESMYWGADGYGGAIYNRGTLVVHQSDFMDNWAEGGNPENPDYPYGFGRGGAIYNASPPPSHACTLWLDSSTIENNTAWPQGGGLANFSDATIVNTTFVGNESVSGAIDDQGFPAARLTNCTLAFNNGPGITSVGAFLINTLLTTNIRGNCSGWVTDGGHNLSSDASCGFTNPASLNNTDPMLGPLADNGGPTPTMALLPGSPAIDAGDTAAAPPTDQRGFRRPFGASADIGAYEYGFVTIRTPPATQTAETGAATALCVEADEYPSQTYQWFFNDIALGDPTTNSCLQLNALQAFQGGVYTVVVSNIFGVVTSTPAILNVIPTVERRVVPGIHVTGEPGSLLNVDYANSLSSPPNWLPLDTVNLTNTSQLCVDLVSPTPAQRFYRAWQPGAASATPSLDLQMVPAIKLTGNVGESLRLDYINAIGPTDAWVTLDTVTLTNTSQLYFDVSTIGQPLRLYRIVSEP